MAHFAELDEKGSFKLIFNIEAGEKYFFNDIVLSLPDDYRKDDFKKIEKLFGELKNEKYGTKSCAHLCTGSPVYCTATASVGMPPRSRAVMSCLKFQQS